MIYIEIKKRHKNNPKSFIHVCNYGYFLPKGKWELIVINVLKWSISIYRKKEYRFKWPVSCA